MRRTLAGVCAALAAASWWAPRASAADGPKIEVGTWWIAQPAGAPLPGPATLPDGGLWVSSDAAGEQSVSAMRFHLDPDEIHPVITLAIHEATPPDADAPPPFSFQSVVVNACLAADEWKPVKVGAWADRPTPNCAQGTAQGTRSADGKTITLDLSAIVLSGDVSIVIFPGQAPNPVPAPPSPVPLPTPPVTAPDLTTFDVTFEAPGADTISVTDNGPGTPPSTDPAPTSPPATFTSVTPSGPVSVGGGFTPPASPAVTDAPAVTAAPATTAAPTRRPARLSRRAKTVAAESPDTAPGSRAIAGIAFLLMAAWWYRSSFGRGGSGKRVTIYDAAPTGPRPALATVGAGSGAGDGPPPIR